MPISSMTGFARRQGHAESVDWVWELKSVNGKGLDIRLRLPPGYDELEAPVRTLLAKRFSRGNLNVSLQLRETGRTLRPRVNRALLEELIALHRELSGALDAAAPRLDTLLSVRGVVEMEEEPESESERSTRLEAMLDDLREASGLLADARRAEGAELAAVLEARLGEIDRLVARAAECAESRPDALRERLREQVAELMAAEPKLPEERLAQEAALLAAKADIREELDRLKAHVVAARELLDETAPAGRRLDFLCQEFNREANTLCSKARDIELTRIGLELKAVIERFREQVQNIE